MIGPASPVKTFPTVPALAKPPYRRSLKDNVVSQHWTNFQHARFQENGVATHSVPEMVPQQGEYAPLLKWGILGGKRFTGGTRHTS